MIKPLSCFLSPKQNITLNGELRELMQWFETCIHQKIIARIPISSTPPSSQQKKTSVEIWDNVISPCPKPKKKHPGDSKWPFHAYYLEVTNITFERGLLNDPKKGTITEIARMSSRLRLQTLWKGHHLQGVESLPGEGAEEKNPIRQKCGNHPLLSYVNGVIYNLNISHL